MPEKTEIRIDNDPDKKFNLSKKKSMLLISAILVILILVLLLVFVLDVNLTGNVISEERAGAKASEFFNLITGGGVEYISSENMGYIYKIILSYDGNEIPLFVTKDGKYFSYGIAYLDNESNSEENFKKTDEIDVEEATIKIIDFFSKEDENLSLQYNSSLDLGALYKIIFIFNNQEVPISITKDGKYLLQEMELDLKKQKQQLEELKEQQANVTPEIQEIPKSDKPKVELFVMTHCPYGTQAEKGIISVFELLRNKIEGNIRFVHYFMHEPEETETPIQICIREEQPEKYLNYLSCFLEDGDSNRCLTEIGIDANKLNLCIGGKAEDYYIFDSELSQSYGVGGSPTLVINEQIISSGRSSAEYLATICSAFNITPEECGGELNSVNPSPGFGYSGSGSNSQASCS